ncbi:MAG: hypothetical protein LBT44_07635 [Clostridiales bacterium]|nr:hypothetical protein [Clostridiales bacterium]
MQGKKQRVILSMGTAIALLVCFLLFRFALFDLHGMKSFPSYLFVLGLIVVALAAVFKSYRAQVGAVTGYAIGFVFAMLFNTDSYDPGSGRLNNAWKIWVAGFLIILFIGIVLEIRHRGKCRF